MSKTNWKKLHSWEGNHKTALTQSSNLWVWVRLQVRFPLTTVLCKCPECHSTIHSKSECGVRRILTTLQCHSHSGCTQLRLATCIFHRQPVYLPLVWPQLHLCAHAPNLYWLAAAEAPRRERRTRETPAAWCPWGRWVRAAWEAHTGLGCVAGTPGARPEWCMGVDGLGLSQGLRSDRQLEAIIMSPQFRQDWGSTWRWALQVQHKQHLQHCLKLCTF